MQQNSSHKLLFHTTLFTSSKMILLFLILTTFKIKAIDAITSCKVLEGTNCVECYQQSVLLNNQCILIQQDKYCLGRDTKGVCIKCNQEFYLDKQKRCTPRTIKKLTQKIGTNSGFKAVSEQFKAKNKDQINQIRDVIKKQNQQLSNSWLSKVYIKNQQILKNSSIRQNKSIDLYLKFIFSYKDNFGQIIIKRQINNFPNFRLWELYNQIYTKTQQQVPLILKQDSNRLSIQRFVNQFRKKNRSPFFLGGFKTKDLQKNLIIYSLFFSSPNQRIKKQMFTLNNPANKTKQTQNITKIQNKIIIQNKTQYKSKISTYERKLIDKTNTQIEQFLQKEDEPLKNTSVIKQSIIQTIQKQKLDILITNMTIAQPQKQNKTINVSLNINNKSISSLSYLSLQNYKIYSKLLTYERVMDKNKFSLELLFKKIKQFFQKNYPKITLDIKISQFCIANKDNFTIIDVSIQPPQLDSTSHYYILLYNKQSQALELISGHDVEPNNRKIYSFDDNNRTRALQVLDSQIKSILFNYVINHPLVDSLNDLFEIKSLKYEAGLYNIDSPRQVREYRYIFFYAKKFDNQYQFVEIRYVTTGSQSTIKLMDHINIPKLNYQNVDDPQPILESFLNSSISSQRIFQNFITPNLYISLKRSIQRKQIYRAQVELQNFMCIYRYDTDFNRYPRLLKNITKSQQNQINQNIRHLAYINNLRAFYESEPGKLQKILIPIVQSFNPLQFTLTMDLIKDITSQFLNISSSIITQMQIIGKKFINSAVEMFSIDFSYKHININPNNQEIKPKKIMFIFLIFNHFFDSKNHLSAKYTPSNSQINDQNIGNNKFLVLKNKRFLLKSDKYLSNLLEMKLSQQAKQSTNNLRRLLFMKNKGKQTVQQSINEQLQLRREQNNKMSISIIDNIYLKQK